MYMYGPPTTNRDDCGNRRGVMGGQYSDHVTGHYDTHTVSISYYNVQQQVALLSI